MHSATNTTSPLITYRNNFQKVFLMEEVSLVPDLNLNTCQKQSTRVILQLHALANYTFHPLNVISGLVLLIRSRFYNLMAAKMN